MVVSIGAVEVAFLLLGIAPALISMGEFRIELDGLAIIGDGVIEVFFGELDPGPRTQGNYAKTA